MALGRLNLSGSDCTCSTPGRDAKGAIEAASAFFLPKEKARPAAFRAECDSGTGGATGFSYEGLALAKEFSSSAMSVEEGKVDVELNRADDEEVSL